MQNQPQTSNNDSLFQLGLLSASSTVAAVFSLLVHAFVIKRGRAGFIGSLPTLVAGNSLGILTTLERGDVPPDALYGALGLSAVASPIAYFKAVGFSGNTLFGYLLLGLISWIAPITTVLGVVIASMLAGFEPDR